MTRAEGSYEVPTSLVTDADAGFSRWRVFETVEQVVPALADSVRAKTHVPRIPADARARSFLWRMSTG